MRLGDLLIEAGLVTPEDVFRAVDRIVTHGGRLGDNLVALGAIDKNVLEAFIHRIPTEPLDIPATGLDDLELPAALSKPSSSRQASSRSPDDQSPSGSARHWHLERAGPVAPMELTPPASTTTAATTTRLVTRILPPRFVDPPAG